MRDAQTVMKRLLLVAIVSLGLPGAAGADDATLEGSGAEDPSAAPASMFALGLTCAPILRTYYESLSPPDQATKKGRYARDQFAAMEAMAEAMARLEGYDEDYVRQWKHAAEQRLDSILIQGDYFVMLRVCLQEADQILVGLKG